MSLQTNFSSLCLEAGLTKKILMQTNVACAPTSKREFCRDHHLTFLCSSLFTKRSVFKKEGDHEVWLKKITNNKIRTITQGLLSSSFAFLLQCGLRFTADSSPVVSHISLLLYFNERSAVKGRARHACDPSTSDWERVRLYGRGGPFLQVLFSFVLFLLVVFLVFFHFKIKGNEQTKNGQGAESHLAHSYVARYLQLSRPNADLC